LIFSRWAQVMMRFERAMYRDPDQDLNKLWWDLVEEYQFVKRPPGRNAPDWAAKIHIAQYPCYYHNYMFGGLAASQILGACEPDGRASQPDGGILVCRKSGSGNRAEGADLPAGCVSPMERAPEAGDRRRTHRKILCRAVLRELRRKCMDDPDVLSSVSERYIVLVLSVGAYDPDYVDAFYGPERFRNEAKERMLKLEEILGEARATLDEIRAVPRSSGDKMRRLRRRYLERQLESLITRVEMLQGRRLTFDEESEALYDARAPIYPATFFQTILDELGRLLPGRFRP